MDDRAVTLSWELLDSSGVTRFRIYSAVENSDDFTLQDSTTSYVKTVTGLPFNQPIRLRVTAVNALGIEGEPSVTVSVVIGLLSIIISDDEKHTKHREVLVQINAPSTASYVMLSEDSLFQDGTPAVPFGPLQSFTLSQGDGLKTVYAHITFVDGSESGGLISDEIILDTEAMIDSVSYSPSGQTFTAGDSILFVVDAAGEAEGEATISFPGGVSISLHDDGVEGDAAAGDGVYSALYTVPTGVTANNDLLTGRFTDAAGNVAAPLMSTAPLNISADPLAVRLTTVEALSSFEISLAWTQSVSSNFSWYGVYRDLDGSVSDSSKLIASINQRFTTSYTDTTVAAATTYYYRVYVIDNSGLRAGSNSNSATTPVNDPPEAVVAAAGLIDSTTAGLTWTMNQERDFGSYRIFRDTLANVDTDDDLIAIITNRTGVSHDDYVPFVSGGGPVSAYYYRVFVFDRQGLFTGSNEVSVTR
jgi:fibronectin type 3 domain-containing protein